MILKKPNEDFISKILKIYSIEEGDELNKKLLKLFNDFPDNKNKFDVLIKVAALNKIYATAITNINPVVEQILKTFNKNFELKTIDDYIILVDNISNTKWKNNSEREFERNNLSFASKFVHFHSDHQIPIYDSYIWILIKGYLGQKNNQRIFYSAPKNYKDFYSTFCKFKNEFDLEKHSNYMIDKFLWQYGKTLAVDIQKEYQEKFISLNQAKTILKNRIKDSS